MTMDFEQFRLRTFVDRLIDLGEVEVHHEPVRLIDLSRIIEGTPKATLFKDAGPQHYELVAAVSGSRTRVAAAFGVPPNEASREYLRRMEAPQPITEVPSREAPVHQMVMTDNDVDLTQLPFFLQHELDGGTYISSAIDFAVDPRSGKRNVGCRRLMLRDERTLTSNLTQPSDLREIYRGCVEDHRPLPISFVVGSHPLDFLAATLRVPLEDELGLIARLRGAPLPVVKSLTNDLLVPADAELVIEGYFDEQGWRVLDGPYGEWWGFYGPTHPDPLFHVTAITHRRDVLFQSVLHGTRHLENCDAAGVANVSVEASVWRALRDGGIHASAVYHVASSPTGSQLRIALPPEQRSKARDAIQALFAIPIVKHVTVVDDDLDIASDAEVAWAQTTRLRPDRDVIIESGFRGRPGLDHTIDEAGTISKIGFDATIPIGAPEDIDHWRPQPPIVERHAPHYASVRDALEAGPKYFVQLVDGLASGDGREIALQLERLRSSGTVDRLPNGEWHLTGD
ncbi:MAG: UbiD family decarboxylase [Chloroflexi bacterium]|nr:UbiD family decarboxylase [Chloroflexota bacterium]